MAYRLPPLNALRAFESAGRHLSFTRAGEELHVTQAAISHQIKALESWLDMTLFKRLNRTILLTEAGQRYLLAVRDALDGEHTGCVHLYHGSREPDGLNMVDALRALAKDHGNSHYVPCVSGDDVPAGCRAGRADVAAFGDHPDLKGWRAFICGYPAMVREARKKALMAGIPIPHIHADPFDFKDLRSVEREGEMARPDGW
jgi:DNA-binding transcriptional LysR family regulator